MPMIANQPATASCGRKGVGRADGRVHQRRENVDFIRTGDAEREGGHSSTVSLNGAPGNMRPAATGR